MIDPASCGGLGVDIRGGEYAGGQVGSIPRGGTVRPASMNQDSTVYHPMSSGLQPVFHCLPDQVPALISCDGPKKIQRPDDFAVVRPLLAGWGEPAGGTCGGLAAARQTRQLPGCREYLGGDSEEPPPGDIKVSIPRQSRGLL